MHWLCFLICKMRMITALSWCIKKIEWDQGVKFLPRAPDQWLRAGAHRWLSPSFPFSCLNHILFKSSPAPVSAWSLLWILYCSTIFLSHLIPDCYYQSILNIWALWWFILYAKLTELRSAAWRTGKSQFLGMSMRVFLEEISIWIYRLSKDHLHPCRWASSNLLGTWI